MAEPTEWPNLLTSLFQLCQDAVEIGTGAAQVFGQTLALIGIHQWNGGADAGGGWY